MVVSTSGADDDALPISGLQHLAFCPRQWALIHLEQAWVENVRTAEGRLLHERADLPGESRRASVRTARGMWLRSEKLYLTGRADIVEFKPEPFPVEYKRGKSKPNDCDTVSSRTGALPGGDAAHRYHRGAIVYGNPRRRLEVEFTPELRSAQKNSPPRCTDCTEAGVTPAATPGLTAALSLVMCVFQRALLMMTPRVG